MRRVLIILCILIAVAATTIHGEEARLLRFPNVNADKVVFTYAGDIYTAPRAGGNATRLTTHPGLEYFPKFSPNGSMIAFTGQYDGDMAVYVMPTDGGPPKRLTYHPGIQRTSERFGPENIVLGWHPDGERVMFRSRKDVMDWWDGQVYLVGIKGGIPIPLPMPTAGFTSLAPNGEKVAYCPICRDFRTWKRYKGGMAQDVWIFDMSDTSSQKITDWVGTDHMPMWYGDKIYFCSDRDGRLNLWSHDINTSEQIQVTTFTDFDVKWPSLGTDGIAFENGGWLYVLDLPSEQLHKVEIDITTDQLFMRDEYEKVEFRRGDYHISPDGNRAIFSIRGDLFTVPKKEGNTRNLTQTPDANERECFWSPDGKHIVYISDESGEEELYLTTNKGEDKTRLTTDGHGRRYTPIWSPDGSRLAFSDKDQILWLVDVETKRLTKVDSSEYRRLHWYNWSPDSRYLTYHKELDNRILAIYIYSVEDGVTHQVTEGFTNDYMPAFDPTGKYLYFLSERNFNPLLGSYEFQFINEAITNLYMILLSTDTESPFTPESDEVEVENKPKPKDDKKNGETDETVTVQIDFNGIFDRQVALDIPSGNYGVIAPIEGAVFYTSRPIYGMRGKISQDDGAIHKFTLDDEKDNVFLNGAGSFLLTYDGSKMLTRKDGCFHIIPTDGKEARLEDTRLDLSNIRMKINHRAEFEQMFDEVWRMERDFFYDSNMHGVDWKAVGDKYRELVPYAGHRSDLTYILGELIGELSCSHTYVGGGDYPDIHGSNVGLFGADFEIDPSSNRIKIARILKGENWNNHLRSPLLDPGVDVKEGDYLLAIDGKEFTADINPYSLTVQKADRIVTITVNDKPTLNGAREYEIRPIDSEETLRYYDIVERNREYVDSVSAGTIGYIHIPDMDSWGLIRFATMFYHQSKKPGLIIDVRYNGGGFVSSLILERLRRVVKAMGMSRNGGVGRMPGYGINAHMITLLNEFSCSDGDYFPYFFREYELGPLMGKRSWGGVIGIGGFTPLLDGGYYTVPEYGIFSLDGKWIMENEGVHPDIVVDNLPERVARGFDDQLDRAIEHIQKKLETDPRELPGLPGHPDPR